MIDSQRPGFEELYKAFYDFFLESIRKDPSPWNKIRLQMMTQYFDDLSLYKAVNPIVARINSNPEDRRAIARAALWDAQFASNNSKIFDNAVGSVPFKTLGPAEPIVPSQEFLIAKAKRGRPAKIIS